MSFANGVFWLAFAVMAPPVFGVWVGYVRALLFVRKARAGRSAGYPYEAFVVGGNAASWLSYVLPMGVLLIGRDELLLASKMPWSRSRATVFRDKPSLLIHGKNSVRTIGSSRRISFEKNDFALALLIEGGWVAPQTVS